MLTRKRAARERRATERRRGGTKGGRKRAGVIHTARGKADKSGFRVQQMVNSTEFGQARTAGVSRKNREQKADFDWKTTGRQTPGSG